MNAQGIEPRPAAKPEKEVNRHRTRDKLDRVEESATDAEAMGSAAKLKTEVTNPDRTTDACDKLPCLEESSGNAEAMGAAKPGNEVTLPEGDHLKDIGILVALNNKVEALHIDNRILKTSLNKVNEKLTTLNNEVDALQIENQTLKTNLGKAHEKLATLNNEVEALNIDNQILKTSLNKTNEQIATLNNEVEALNSDNQILKISLNKANEKVSELNIAMQALHRDQEIIMTKLNKAEDESKLLFEENRVLYEANKELHSLLESEHTPSNHSAVNVAALSTGREQQTDQPSEGEEPLELDPKDKGLLNFLKAVSTVAGTVTNAFDFAFLVLAYTSSGRHATSESQKLILGVGGICFMLFSIHSRDGPFTRRKGEED